MLNKASLIGLTGQDPEIKTTSTGKELALFSLATSENWKDKATGERKDKTEWHKIVVYNQHIVEFCRNYVKKGQKLYIEGKIQTRKYKSANEAKSRYMTEIVLDHGAILQALTKADVVGQPFHEPKEPESLNNFDENTDDIPF